MQGLQQESSRFVKRRFERSTLARCLRAPGSHGDAY